MSNILKCCMLYSFSDQDGMFGKTEFDKLAPYIDGFSLMTYDFSNPQR